MRCVLVLSDCFKQKGKIIGQVSLSSELVTSIKNYRDHLKNIRQQPTAADYKDFKDFNFPSEFLELINSRNAQFSYGDNKLATPWFTSGAFYLEFVFYGKELLQKYLPGSNNGFISVIEILPGQTAKDAAF